MNPSSLPSVEARGRSSGRLRIRLWAGGACAAVLALGLGAAAHSALVGAFAAKDEVITKHAAAVRLADRVRAQSARAGESARTYLLTQNPAFLNDMARARDELHRVLEALSAHAKSDEQKAALSGVRDAAAGVARVTDALVDLRRRGAGADAMGSLLAGDAQVSLGALDAAVERLVRLEEKELAAARAASAAAVSESFRVLSLAIAAALLLCALLALALRRAFNQREALLVREREARAQAESERARLALVAGELEEQQRVRELFLGIVGHDLRTPLQAISLGAQLLVDRGRLDEADARTARRVKSSAARMTALIADLLDFARTRVGHGIPVEKEQGDLVRLLRQSVDELSAAHPGRRIVLEGERSALACFDAGRLAQVAANLIGNALEHASTPQAPVVVRVETDDQHAGFVVENEAAPIPDDELRTLFEPFRTGSGRSRGIGLGLYITRLIVEAHEGRLAAVSRNGRTSFSVRLPRERALGEGASTTEPRPDAEASAPAADSAGASSTGDRRETAL